MYATRTVTARQLPELLAKGQQVTILDDLTELNLTSAVMSIANAVLVVWNETRTGSYLPNQRVEIVDWVATEAERYAEYEAELAAERAVERFFEEGPHGPQDDPRERALWALEDQRYADRHGL